MKQFAKRLVKRILPRAWTDLIRANLEMPRRAFVLEKQVRILTQTLAQSHYQTLVPHGHFHAEINRHEMKVFSQNGEDGILLYLFSKVGATDRRFVEFGIGDGTECNTANLSINFGWRGLLMDCVDANIVRARKFYRQQLGDRADHVKIVNCFVTAENINPVLVENGFEHEIDLLSIDIDGNDYWVWKVITAVNPRVVIVEYNPCLGVEEAITVAYDPAFDRWQKHDSLLYFGASLPALTKLARAKGYVLAGCDQHGVNAFFVREDIAKNRIEVLSPREAYYPLQDRLLGLITPGHFGKVAHLDFEHV